MARYSISQPVNAVEAPRLLTGKGRYTDDIQIPHMADAVFLRSPHAHADITAMDVEAARAMPGVIAVLTGADYEGDGLGTIPGGAPPKRSNGEPGYRPPRPGLATNRVYHVGQTIAVVIAESINAAKDAVEAIEIDFAPLDVQIDPVAANTPDADRLWEDCAENEAFAAEKGDAEATEAALAAAPHVVRDTFPVTRVTANAMEPRAVVAEYDQGRDHFTVYACQQRPFIWRTHMTRDIFDIPENQMTMIAGDVGGSFGMKGGLHPEVPVVAWAAKRTGRPVKWNCERSEAHISDDQARDVIVDAELGFDDEGNILAVRFRAHANMGAFLSMTGFGAPNGIASYLCGTYAVPTIHGRSTAVLTNTGTLANYRGPSGTPGSYILERLVDMAARELGMDPVDIRRRNYIPADAMPYKLPNGSTYDCGEFETVMDKCLELGDYNGASKRREDAKARGKLYGIGVSSSVDPSGSPAPESVQLRFDPGGTVTIMAASTAGGQNHATIYTQIVSDMLGIDAEDIRVVEGDTSQVAWGSGTGAARTATIAGSTVMLATEKTREKGRRIAAHMLEADVDEVTFEDGHYSVPGTNRTIGFKDVAIAAFKPKMLPPDVEIGMYETATWQPEVANIPNTFHICEVEIDPDTCKPEIVRYNVAYDVGVELNPTLVRGQAQGAIAQGAGQALMEKMTYDPETGQVLTGSFMDYCMPRATDFCHMDFVSHPVPTDTNPLGVKGAGEGGTVGSLPAILNAINDALAPLGVDNLKMPATSERIWRAVRDAESAA
jgi:carbon-monoxide dehydrogenase large subunit